MTLPLVYAGITREGAPIDVRERFQGDRSARRRLAVHLRQHTRETYILHTCERFEVYAVAETISAETLRRVIAGCFHVPPALVERYLAVHRGEAVARHWLEVASGLASRLAGESHVLGQVKRAYAEALDERWLGPILAGLGRTAIRAGKRVRTAMISFRSPSPAALAIERLHTDLGSLRHRRIVVLGTGCIAREVRGALHRAGSTIVIASRDLHRAETFRGLPGVVGVLARPALSHVLASADGLVTCTHTDQPLLDAAQLACRRGRRLSIIDLGMPRNVAMDVTTHADVLLTHLEGLHARATLTPHIREAADQIIQQELDRFRSWHANRRASYQIARLVRCAPRATAAERRQLDRLIRSIKAQVAA